MNIKNIIFFLILIFNSVFGYINSTEPTKILDTKNNRGLIFVLEGISSSGKTTMSQVLLKELLKSSKNWLIQSLDDNAKDSDNEDSDLDEEDADSEYKDKEADENQSMIPTLKMLASTNMNIIYDTVLSPEYISKFINHLKKDGYKVYAIHVFCNPGSLAERTQSRNSAATTPQQIKAEARGPYQAMLQFKDRYEKVTSGINSPQSFVFSPKNDVPKIEVLLKQSYYTWDSTSSKAKKHTLDEKERDRTLNALFQDLAICGDEQEVTIQTKYNYALVVDNTQKEAFIIVKNFILEKIKEDH